MIRNVARGQRFITEGEVSKSVFIIMRGRAIAWTIYHGRKHVLAEIRDGDIVGELSFLDGKPRSANVTALVDCVVREIQFDDNLHQRVLENEPNLSVLIRHLASRLRSANASLLAYKATLANLHRNYQNATAVTKKMYALEMARVLQCLAQAAQHGSTKDLYDFLKCQLSMARAPIDAETFGESLKEFGLVYPGEGECWEWHIEKLRSLSLRLFTVADLPFYETSPAAIELLSRLLLRIKAQSIGSEQEGDSVEVVVSDLYESSSPSEVAFVQEGLKDLDTLGWITLQRDFAVFRMDAKFLFETNEALLFMRRVDPGRFAFFRDPGREAA